MYPDNCPLAVLTCGTLSSGHLLVPHAEKHEVITSSLPVAWHPFGRQEGS